MKCLSERSSLFQKSKTNKLQKISDKVKNISGFSTVTGVAVILTSIVILTSGPSLKVHAAPLLFVQEPMIVSKELITDSENCEWVSNSSATYPDCCPMLSCATATPLTTIDPLLCYDLASTFACGFWYNITAGCNETSAFMYNVSQIYCRNTCGLC
ncbi:hypothetical protein PoB_004538500 [Plakobranchus ocellatus]|uniref:ShKT domain-containing protein n=1 Tax=Plakobranchus ocellatus TaxID=259542 RepID=A0AAV4BE68_9GAST|nr:hypothetical protein PoB_004538500 [Plakobranchus ocellatus]